MMYVVITDFDEWHFTSACLESLYGSRTMDFGIIVVDHGTTDETKTMLATLFPNVIRVAGTPELWWAGATNLGVKEATRRGADSVILLNNDCEVEPDTIQTLLRHRRDTDCRIVSPMQVNKRSQRVIPPPTTCFTLGFPTLQLPGSLAHLNEGHALVRVTLIGGGRGVLIPLDVFAKVGLFDEAHLPHYYADHDFYLRCRRSGISLYVAMDAKVFVNDGKTTIAHNPGQLGLGGFVRTLSSRRSHRNLQDLRTLFKRYYPVKSLYFIGLSLNIARYTITYLVKRVIFLSLQRKTTSSV